MIFKVDFEKTFDSARWDFLDVVMDKLGFGSKWRFWIKGCLRNARASILVNGSPTVEFEISRGLRQGDPLSPFLFILAMEGLHSLICKATHLGIYTGTHVGDNNLLLSHLIYADDVVFFGDWSSTNAHNLLCILQCFYLVSELKLNTHKSSIFGVCVSDASVATMAKTLGCEASKLPFKYLGVPVGCNTARCHNWDAIVRKFSSKLSHWNARLLSIGGHLSLINAVLGNLPTYYMSLYKMPVAIYNKLESMRSQFFIGGDQGSKKMAWTQWNTCMASKQKGGLGIGSINALNVGLLFKWLWRFLSQSSDLWISVIKEIYRFHGDIFYSSSYSSCLSPWSGILSVIKSLKKKGINLISLCSCKHGNGVSTNFLDDVWCGSQPLKDWSIIFRRPPRRGIESSQFSKLKHLVGSVVLSDHRDSWTWSLDGSKGFFVASRLTLNKLPSRMNLDRKGIDVDSVLCPTCPEDVETNIMEWHSWLDSSSLSSKARLFLDGVGGTLMCYDATYKYYYHYHEAVELRGDRYYKFSRNQVKEDSTE
ncbi:RNA-directed DNA polymerase, eukaryota, reverse transcriptase zinc-binding domain protein [Tanacetum coccineum]